MEKEFVHSNNFVNIEPFKLMIIGQDRFGQDVYKAAKQLPNVEIPLIIAPKSPKDPLRISAESDGHNVLGLIETDNPDLPRRISEDLGIDLGIMAFVNKILDPNIFKAPKKETIQYHPSLLPRWRGRSAINEAIIHGDEKTGFTIFYPDGEIDTGPILMQKEFPILPTDNVASLYVRDLAPQGVMAIIEAIEIIRDGRESSFIKPQDENFVTHARWIKKGDSFMNKWDQDAEEVDRFLRGMSTPGAWTRLFPNETSDLSNPDFIENQMKPGKIINLLKPSISKFAHLHQPGQIIDISENGLCVAIKDGSVNFESLQDSEIYLDKKGGLDEIPQQERGQKLSSVEYANLHKLLPGMSFLIR